jgi:Mn2+/Fe2+ NRAMP family transporter
VDTKTSGSVPEKPPVEPGCLPAWNMDEMPAPVRFGVHNLLAMLGPGLVMVGGSIGTGEWVQGAGFAALYGGALLWAASLAILCQVFLNTEVMRYTLVTGEPVFTGFMRTRPGPRFWLIWYVLLDCLSWWPALGGLAAQILLYIVTRDAPAPGAVKGMTIAVLLLCGFLLCFGRKIYNTLEVVLSGKVIFVLGYLLFVTVAFVPWSVWAEIIGGMVNPFRVPEGGYEHVKWNLVGGVVGVAGIGGMGNILASNYVREKGWGMGAKVGAIPSAFGDQTIELSHIGTMARPDAQGVARFKQWWTYITADQWGMWFWGSIVGMLLPCVLAAGYLKENYLVTGGKPWQAASALARDFGAVHGPVFTFLTLMCGLVILLPGQFSAMDGIARRWCDALWSGSRRIRQMESHKVRYVYYTFIGTYVMAGICSTLIFGLDAPKMILINANLANLMLTSCILHTLYVNRTLLPPEFRPSIAKCAGLVLAALFYAGLFGLVTWQQLVTGDLWKALGIAR